MGELRIGFTNVENGASGVVQAVGVGSKVTLGAAAVIGGTFKTANGGVIMSLGGSSILNGSNPAAPVTNAGSIVVPDGSALTLLGTINNKGSIAINGSTSLLCGSPVAARRCRAAAR